MDSILNSIKKLLGIQPEYDAFDEDIIMHINTVFAILNQLNIGPIEGFYITGKDETWYEYIDSPNITMVKSFIHLKVKLLFDPPSSTSTIESINNTIKELEWRLFLEGDKLEGGEIDEGDEGDEW